LGGQPARGTNTVATLADSTLSWAIERVQVYAWDKDRVVAHLGLTGDG
jgi:hypothetical protein